VAGCPSCQQINSVKVYGKCDITLNDLIFCVQQHGVCGSDFVVDILLFNSVYFSSRLIAHGKNVQ